MGRPCTVCSSDKHNRVDSALAAGTAQSVVAGLFGFTQSSISRHASRHLGNAIGYFDISHARAGLRDEDLLSTLLQMLNDVRAVAASAAAANRASLVLQANGSAREIVKAIHDIQGNGDSTADLLDSIREGAAIAQAAAAVIRQFPEFGAALAEQFERTDPEMRDQILRLADRSRKSLNLERTS